MSNAYHFEGRLADEPQAGNTESAPCRFRLIRNEHVGTDGNGQARPERVVSIPFAAFGGRGRAIAQHARKGDQLIVTAHIENNRYTDANNVEHFDYNFVVDDFSFGAPGEIKRQELAARRS